MPNFVTNTAIVDESWNARGLITHNAVTKALVRADDGTLWAAVREGHVKEYINIYRSTDNGFSWENMYAGDFLEVTRRTGLSGYNQNGPFLHLTLNEERDRLILWHTFYETSLNRHDVEPFIFEITDSGLERLTTVTDHAVTGIVLDADQLALDISYTSTHIYLTYASSSVINVQVFDHTYQSSTDGAEDFGTAYFNTFATHANNDNTLDMVVLKDDTTTYTIQYVKFNRITGTFTTPITISSFNAADIADINLERDGEGNLLCLWTQENAAGTAITEKYATSVDDGTTWAVETIPVTSGQTDLTDTATGRLAGRTVALGGLQGFLVGYVRNLNGTPTAYIRTLLYNSTSNSYDLGTEKVAIDDTVIGYRFFRPTGNQLMDLDQLGQIRVAYQSVQATSQVQVDTNPARFSQQLLRESAAFAEDQSSYETDVPSSTDQIVVNFNLLGSVGENVDYYSEGLTGSITNRYIAAFNRVGTSVTLRKYEPTEDAQTSDRAAYGSATDYITKVHLQPINYDAPVAVGSESFTTYIERDTRKIHIPPTTHISRTFVLNAGNHLKRTVWTLAFDGNEYEISQVVPFFVNDQIAYYQANAYVIGPSNDPFSRTILPSET